MKGRALKPDDTIPRNVQVKIGPKDDAFVNGIALGLTQLVSAEKASSSICEVSLRGPFSRNEHIERERAHAVAHLIRSNVFIPVGHDRGPYRLHLALDRDELAFQAATERRVNVIAHQISLIPIRKFLKHYVLTCENYYDAMPRASVAALAKIDGGRCALREQGAEFLKKRLADKLVTDNDTARQLFTLVYVLLMRNTPAHR
ncbi:UPF0262 family protein [Mesorhizobium sp.]|uniref:UPF0262 family protein n=1 Tax=Mesorhizobium sp. TaxID=1871066 RepID=UPI00120CF3EA|nr:UPF0262 family protein [Mesorhizobium sp.]TIN74648.1 MAG: UPF0262 family protein [Mesorhizobium sp.]TIO65329.1 MAG: UPF0262 family protein [Mesorhizobium sp.]TJV90148.1 MAG: UPF0262 family protein [Mesorhizobium sp.]